jgi:hypothetical protein
MIRSGYRSALAAVVLSMVLCCSTQRTSAIEEIAHYDTRGWAHDVVLDGDLLYVADRQGGFLVFDRAAGWSFPKIFTPVEDVISLAPHSGRPVLASRFEGLVLVSDSGEMEAGYANGDIANAVVTRGDVAFAAYGAHGLVVARMDDGGLSVLAELPTPGWSHDVKLSGDRALLADWQYGLRVVDIRRPENPVELGVLPSQATAICIALEETPQSPLAALAEGHAGVSLVAFDPAGHPSRVARHGLGLNPGDEPHPERGGWAHGVALCRGYLFVANWKRGLEVLDVRDPGRPQLLQEVPTSGTSLGVKAEAQQDGTVLAFLADGEAGLRVFRLAPLRQ